MNTIINGEPHELPPGLTAEGLMVFLKLDARKVALECNEVIIPRSRYSDTLIQDGDRIEIVQFIGGG